MQEKNRLNNLLGLPLPYWLAGCATIAFGFIIACSDSSNARPNFVFKDPPSSGAAAKIGDTVVTDADLEKGDSRTAAQFAELKQKMYDLKMLRVRELMREKLLGAKAEKAKKSVDQYIKDEIVKNKAKPSDKEFNDFIKERGVPTDKISPQLKERIMGYLSEQKQDELVDAYVAKLTKNDPVEIYFKRPEGIQIDLGDAPIWGNESAPVTIVEFSDMQCPFCARAATTVDQLKKKYGKSKIKIAFKHFPLPSHAQAKPAALASMCVHEQGASKFWKFHDVVFENYREINDENILKWAKQAGASEKQFKECLDAKKYEKLVDGDVEYGQKLGVQATPTFYVNGRLLSGAQPVEKFSEIIDEELAAAKK